MKRVLLLEDRIKRQETYITNADVNLQKYIDSDILDNKIGLKYTEVVKLFEKFITENGKNYKIIIAHESALKSINKIDFLKEFCNENNLSLVLFSGGINFSSYSNNNYELVYLNSRDLYSKNFLLLLDDINDNDSYDLLQLIYGKNYKKNIILSVFDNIDKFFLRDDLSDPYPFSDFIDDIKIKEIKSIDCKLPEENKDWYSLSELYDYSDSLKKIIIQEVYNA